MGNTATFTKKMSMKVRISQSLWFYTCYMKIEDNNIYDKSLSELLRGFSMLFRNFFVQCRIFLADVKSLPSNINLKRKFLKMHCRFLYNN